MRKIEAAIQKAVIDWCRKRPLFELAFHVNNEGFKSVGQAAQDKKLGILAGIPDLCIPLPNGNTLWLELKAIKGKLSPKQKEMHEKLENRGHTVAVAYGYLHAVEILETVESGYYGKV